MLRNIHPVSSSWALICKAKFAPSADCFFLRHPWPPGRVRTLMVSEAGGAETFHFQKKTKNHPGNQGGNLVLCGEPWWTPTCMSFRVSSKGSFSDYAFWNYSFTKSGDTSYGCPVWYLFSSPFYWFIRNPARFRVTQRSPDTWANQVFQDFQGRMTCKQPNFPAMFSWRANFGKWQVYVCICL